MDTLSSMAASVIHYEEPSKFPGIDIDLSLVIGADQTYSTLSAAWQNVTPLLKNVALIDSYNGVVKSITLRFTFSSNEKTLAKNEVQGYVDNLLKIFVPLAFFVVLRYAVYSVYSTVLLYANKTPGPAYNEM